MLGRHNIFAKLVAACVALVAFVSIAQAHPHIWIDARIGIVFDNRGEISALRHEWTFDQAFSSWSIQGLDGDNDGVISAEEFRGLAEENMIGLADYDFYTFAGGRSGAVRFAAGADPVLEYDGARTTLKFTLVPDAPMAVGDRFEIEVADPEYYAAMTFLTDRGVTMENAPDNCSAVVNAPKKIDPAIEQRLFELGSDITELPADLRSAADDLANVVVVSCEGLATMSAQQAAARLARQGGSPFVAPPAELGFPISRTGFFGWVNSQQQAFYGALTDALGRLKQDGNAFWVLGGLSFLYGIFHAAGPGHGKVIITSYVLATEVEVRRGIALSFAAAMMQATTAVVFILVAAQIFNLTSIGLRDSAQILVIGSYIMVIALGIWLMARKIFGFGHSHNHNHKHAHDAGAHDHDDHVHAITPAHLRRGWREAMGVVLAVGLRPCSGALVVMVFALSQGVVFAGIGAVFLMGVGTAITVSALALLAVGSKNATRFFKDGPYASIAEDVFWWLEMFGALLVFAFGMILLLANI